MKRARHIKMTEREFKQNKRREFKQVSNALDTLRLGCGYLPKEAYATLLKADAEFQKAYKICKAWWKNA